MSDAFATTATPPTAPALPIAGTSSPEVDAAEPQVAPQHTPVADFDAYKANTDKTIAELLAKVEASSPPPPVAPVYTSHVYTDAVNQFGEGADPALLASFVEHAQAVNALDYQIATTTDPAKRASLRQNLRNRRSNQVSARAQILLLQREDQRARQVSQEESRQADRASEPATAPVFMTTLQDQSRVMPALEESTPLLAAMLRSGAIKYETLLSRISDPDNNAAGQWNSIMLATENQIATGAFVAPAATTTGAEPSAAPPLPSGMPAANGGQSGMPAPATTDAQRKESDAAVVARMQAQAIQ